MSEALRLIHRLPLQLKEDYNCLRAVILTESIQKLTVYQYARHMAGPSFRGVRTTIGSIRRMQNLGLINEDGSPNTDRILELAWSYMTTEERYMDAFYDSL